MEAPSILTEADQKEVNAYAAGIKKDIIARLKARKTDEFVDAVNAKLREEMLACAQEFFAKELRDDLLKQFASQKAVLINIAAEAVAAIANSIKEQLAELVADKMSNSWEAKKVISALFC